MSSSIKSQVKVDRKVKILMRDGVALTADIYRPQNQFTTLPVLLMRLPYGRAIASTVTYAHPSWYAAHGYIVVIQDVRGCGTSEGEFYPFRNEYDDGYDTVIWCAQKLVGSNGKVGMYGFSYQGVTQFQAAVMQPPGLITICPAMATVDFYHGWFYFGGAFALEFALTWALQLTQNQAYFHKIEPLATDLLQAQSEISKWLGFVPVDQVKILKSTTLGQFFFDWVKNSEPDHEYWQALNPLSQLAQFDLPALHITGWADPFVAASVFAFDQARKITKQPQFLVGGPWQHLPWRSQVGELDFGQAAIPKIDQLQIDWFDYWLKDIDNGVMARASAQLFLMGANHWLDQTEWQSATKNYYLHENGVLIEDISELVPTDFPDIYVYDPHIPNPSTAYGAYDQRKVHQRPDLLLFFSLPLSQDLKVVGIAIFRLFASTSVSGTDWVIKLSDVYPDGRQMLVTMGVLRTKSPDSDHNSANNEPEPKVLIYTIEMRPTCHQFASGHRLGIAISSAAFPLIERHSNSSKAPSSCVASEFMVATQQIYHDQKFPSHLELPVENP